MTYNKFVNLSILVERQASHLQAHLKKKFDLIPALTDVVKGYSNHEKGLLTEVTRLRSQWGAASDVNEKLKTSNMLESALSKLLIVHERYPQIKADRSFNNIQKNIGYVERELLHERKVYNKRVSYFNQKVQQFPSNILAKIFGFKEKQFFSIENE
ncbi:LemA family protein [Candidatus Woesearchaeota archaeon]|nr:LemA family protein [Candidatus Woesearchaeota archaeon]